jgi:hypothetical protein
MVLLIVVTLLIQLFGKMAHSIMVNLHLIMEQHIPYQIHNPNTLGKMVYLMMVSLELLMD